MKKNLRNSLKNWVKRIKWLRYEIIELEDKLDYYESRMFHYKSPSFEPRISSNSFYQSDLDFWVDKNINLEDKIKKNKKEVARYDKFIDNLNSKEKTLFQTYYIDGLSNKECMRVAGMTQHMFYYYMDKIYYIYYTTS